MINRRIRCRFCWRDHEVPVGVFAGHVICPEANEPAWHGQQPLRCYQCDEPAAAGHRGPDRKPSCRLHVERDDVPAPL